MAIFPEEVSEALYMLAAGYSLEDAYKELEKQQDDKEVDDKDFEKALSHPDSQRRFHIVSDALELQEMLNAPLEQWRVFLHPSQRKIVQMHANGPVRVLGGAGTGKTGCRNAQDKMAFGKLLYREDGQNPFRYFHN